MVITLSTLWLASCEPIEIDADLPDRDGLVTITGLFSADSAWHIDITSSKSILNSKVEYGIFDTDITPITNAQVIIREDGQSVESLVYTKGNYNTDYGTYLSPDPGKRPIPGKTYDIQVTVPGIGTSSAKSFIPTPVRLRDVAAETSLTTVSTKVISGTFKDPLYLRAVPAEITIDDPAGDNYYEVIVRYEADAGTPPPFNRISGTPVFTKDLRFHNTGLTPGSGKIIPGQNDLSYSVIFHDTDAEAKQLKVPIMMPVVTTFGNDGREQLRTDIHYIVILRTLSHEYFQYKASQELQAYSYDDPFAQPVVVYNNVEGGIGIFAAYSEDAVEVILK